MAYTYFEDLRTTDFWLELLVLIGIWRMCSRQLWTNLNHWLTLIFILTLHVTLTLQLVYIPTKFNSNRHGDL